MSRQDPSAFRCILVDCAHRGIEWHDATSRRIPNHCVLVCRLFTCTHGNDSAAANPFPIKKKKLREGNSISRPLSIIKARSSAALFLDSRASFFAVREKRPQACQKGLLQLGPDNPLPAYRVPSLHSAILRLLLLCCCGSPSVTRTCISPL